MKVFFDTSVLVAALVAGHTMHARAFPWLQQAHSGQHEFLVGAHSLAELYFDIAQACEYLRRFTAGQAFSD